MTLEPIPYATLESGPGFAGDRRVGLLVFGIISLLVGAFFTLGAAGAMVVLFQLRTTAMGVPWFAVVVGAFSAAYAALAGLFISVGVASIRCRRWVRPVVVALGWPIVVSSALLVVWLLLRAVDQARLTGRADAVEEFWFPVVFMTFAGVVFPGVFVWFYSTAKVRRTLAAYQPRPSWTERNPLPVFVACACLVGGGVLTVALSLFDAVPAFGTYVTGAAAAALAVLAGLAMIAAAVMMHLGVVAGWWLALGVVAGGFVSAIVTFCRLGVIEFYRQGGLPQDALDELATLPSLGGVTPIGFAVVVMTISVGFLLSVRGGVGAARHDGGRDGAGAGAYPAVL
jgi:hypothetical protein